MHRRHAIVFSVDGVRVCDPQEQYVCADPTYVSFITDWAAVHRDRCGCLRSCSHTDFQLQLSSNKLSNFAVETIARALIVDYVCSNDTGTEICGYEPGLNESIADMHDNYVDLSIYYPDLSIEKVQEQPAYSVLALLCDVGGAMGLILGSTILTLAEVSEFLVNIVYDAIFFKISTMRRPPDRKVNPVGT